MAQPKLAKEVTLAATSGEALESKPGTERQIVSVTAIREEKFLEATMNARADLHEREVAQTATMAHILEQVPPSSCWHWDIKE